MIWPLSRKSKHPKIVEYKSATRLYVSSRLWASKKGFFKDLDKILGKNREHCISSFMGIAEIVDYGLRFKVTQLKLEDYLDDADILTHLEGWVLVDEVALKKIKCLRLIEPRQDYIATDNVRFWVDGEEEITGLLQERFTKLVSERFENYMGMSGDIKAIKYPKECPGCRWPLAPNLRENGVFMKGGLCRECGYLLFDFNFEVAKKLFYKIVSWQESGNGKELIKLAP